MANLIDNSIIPGASYYIYEGNPTKDSSVVETPGGLRSGSKNVTFYTFDGNPIVTMEHNMHMEAIKAKLDPDAPNPMPASYRKIWWPAFRMGFGMTKGAPGYAVFFHDKNGNRIGWNRLASADQEINKHSRHPFDLSVATEEPADFSQKPWFSQNDEPSEKIGCIIS